MIQDTLEKQSSASNISSNNTEQNIYKSIALNNFDRALSLLDRNPYSKTYGSFSRNYWHYKMASDFPSATDQQAVLALSSIYLLNSSSNKYYLNQKLLDLIEAGIKYWGKIQNPDGSFNEWYPNEHSHVATAFTSYAISESLLMLKDSINKKTLNKTINCLRKSGLWLIKNIDKVVSNHTAGATAALYNIYLLTKEDIFLKGCDKNLQTLINLQDSEGWYKEYEGADLGYLGVSIDYLAKYWHRSNDPIAEESLKKALDFLSWFYQDTSGTTGGDFGSRNTKYMLPHGLLLLSNRFEKARILENNFRATLVQNKTINPQSIDDRYFLFFHYPNHAQAALENISDINHIKSKNFLKIFPSCGLISHKEENCQFITNLKKGGVSTINLKDNKVILNDSGYFAKLGNKTLTTQTLSEILQITTLEQLPFTAKIKTNFVEYNSTGPSLKNLMVPFRIFNYTIGKSPLFMRGFNKLIKSRFISQTKPSKETLILERSVYIDTEKIVIEDNIISELKNLKLDKLSIEPAISIMHVPSSKFFHFSDLNKDSNFNPINLEDTFNKNGRVKIKRVVNLNGVIDLIIS